MRQKLTKLLALVLTIILAASAVLPMEANAAALTGAQLKQQIRRTYSRARSSFGRSFDGYCGTMTGYQLYYLGLTAGRDNQNGNEGYDLYCKQDYSSGGYKIKAYAAKRYTLRQALDAITDKGKRDAYNILVGFQSTPSRAGRKFGHSCVIHGIVDGQVYFTESYPVYLNGTRYKEGAPISCSIAAFCDYYKSTTTKFDGVIHFGSKDYADSCESYPTSLDAIVLDPVSVMSQPCNKETDKSSRKLETLSAGEKVNVSAVLKNDAGEYWYQLDQGYVPAQTLQVNTFLYEDVTAEDIQAPTALRKGKSFNLQGALETRNNSIYSVRCQVFSLKEQDPVFTSVDLVEEDRYTLKNSHIADAMAFRELPLGSYRLELAAVIGSYYCEKGQLCVQWQTLPLWSSQFQVTEKKINACRITFDPLEGQTNVNCTTVVDGQSVGALPTACNGDQVFLGWFTKDAQRITADFVPQEDMTLYARFCTVQELEAAADKCWYLYADGLTAMGCAELDGELYYFTVTAPTRL